MVLTVDDASSVAIEPLISGCEAEWAAFLLRSNNGCLFHDLDFLAYHPADRFCFHHLIARQDGKVLALIPGGLSRQDGRPIFISPLGASVGGVVVAPGLSVTRGLALITALQNYTIDRGWEGMSLTLAPSIYGRQPDDLLAFGLFAQGFRQKHRWLCYMVELVPGMIENGMPNCFRRRMRDNVRAAGRHGVVVRDAGAEALDDFFIVFDATYRRHNIAPTHTHDEIRRLFALVPSRMRLSVAYERDHPVAGVLLMLLNDRVATTFYICNSDDHADAHGVPMAIIHSMEFLLERGYRYLDLGPSARDGGYNRGVSFFKEGLGAVGHCRDQWSWRVGDTADPDIAGDAVAGSAS